MSFDKIDITMSYTEEVKTLKRKMEVFEKYVRDIMVMFNDIKNDFHRIFPDKKKHKFHRINPKTGQREHYEGTTV